MPHTAQRLAAAVVKAVSAVEKTDEEIADLLSDLTISKTLNLGGAILHQGYHAILGSVVVICSASGTGALIEYAASATSPPKLHVVS